MTRIIKITGTLTLALLSIIMPAVAFGQGKGESAIGETMRSSGRIYVVIAVILTILIGLFLYLIRLDRKISKIEKEHQHHS
jgi:hypothetical protein